MRFIALKRLIPLLLFLTVTLQARTEPFIIGADISTVPEHEAKGERYADNGIVKDIFTILKDHGFNAIRLRTFHNPAATGGSATTTGAAYDGYSTSGFCDLAHLKPMALRTKNAGMKFLLNIQYSDNWTDPAKQYKPHAWGSLTTSQLTDTVRAYTKNIFTELKNQGSLPDMVQLGNEISNGMLFPDGVASSSWTNFAAFLKAAIAGVKDVDTTVKIVMHLDFGGNNSNARWWIDSAVKNGVNFDILGLSCYTTYQGLPDTWDANFKDLATRYPKYYFIIAEYSQEKRKANDIIFNLPNEKGLGTFIYDPIQYGEYFFTYNNTIKGWATNSLIDLYPQMSSDYGNQVIVKAKQKEIHFPSTKNKIYLAQTGKSKVTISNYTGIDGQTISMTLYNLSGRKISQSKGAYYLKNNEIQIPPVSMAGTYLISLQSNQLTINEYITIQ